MVVVAVYIKDVWFDKTAITNIFGRKNMIQQYRVTYESLEQMFIFQHEENNNPNVHFRMYESGLHYYDPAEYFTFVTTVTENNKYYIKRYIKVAERVAELYGTVTYPSVLDYIWAIQID